MPVFIPSLKKSGHLEEIEMTVCIVGSRKLGSQDEYGMQGWELFAPRLTIYGFDADADACNQMNADLQARQVNWTEKHIPLALWNSAGKATLHVTQFPGCSSLYAPNELYIKRFRGNSELIKLVATEELPTTTLDEFCIREGINEIDLIQIDTQGGELPVLEGASGILERGVLAVIAEVEFIRIYANQPLFGDVDVYLRNKGFTLFDLVHLHRDYRRSSPIISNEHPGQLVWGDAFYLRDPLQEQINTYLKTPHKILKLACIADVLNFSDYTLELLEYLTLEYGKDPKYNFANNIIDSLAQFPGLVKQGLSALPVIDRIRDYASGYNFSGPTKVVQVGLQASSLSISEPEPEPSVSWQQQAHQCLMRGDYAQATSYYEQAVEAEPSVKCHYWHLGLMLLLQGQETEAQTTWLLAIAEGEPEQIEQWTVELTQVLQTEAERREAVEDYPIAWVLRQHMREIFPRNINNLLHLILLSIKLNNFTGEELTDLGIMELLQEEQSLVDSGLLLQVLQSILEHASFAPWATAFSEACLSHAPEPQAFVNVVNQSRNQRQGAKYSYLDEESIIDKYLKELNIKNKYCVDIAASDGVTMSNTYFLFQRGWSGLAVEYDRNKFAKLAAEYAKLEKVNCSQCMVTPENVVSLLKAHQISEKFGFLNLDIDGYDYFVLEKILDSFRPSILCVEINEKIPPPLKFTVNWDINYVWANDHFYGQSISQLNIICEKYDYALVELHYNNAFLIPKEISPRPSLTPEEAYKKGYLERPDRKEKFPWNANMEEVLNLSSQEALAYVDNFFAKYKGKFVCTL
jgi:FkbM family methyltransferase